MAGTRGQLCGVVAAAVVVAALVGAAGKPTSLQGKGFVFHWVLHTPGALGIARGARPLWPRRERTYFPSQGYVFSAVIERIASLRRGVLYRQEWKASDLPVADLVLRYCISFPID